MDAAVGKEPQIAEASEGRESTNYGAEAGIQHSHHGLHYSGDKLSGSEAKH